MTTTLPTFTLVLLEYPDSTWSIEPVGMGEVPGYAPDRAGPQGCFRRGPDLSALIHDEARTVLSAALDLDRFGFDLRFCGPTGECLVRTEVHHGNELVYATPELRQKAGLAAVS